MSISIFPKSGKIIDMGNVEEKNTEKTFFVTSALSEVKKYSWCVFPVDLENREKKQHVTSFSSSKKEVTKKMPRRSKAVLLPSLGGATTNLKPSFSRNEKKVSLSEAVSLLYSCFWTFPHISGFSIFFQKVYRTRIGEWTLEGMEIGKWREINI